MKNNLKSALEQAIAQLQAEQILPSDIEPKISIDRPRDPSHGDFASNVALTLAKAAKTNPRALAEKLIEHLQAVPNVTEVSIAGPGFINFRISESAITDIVKTIHDQGDKFGTADIGQGQRVHIEFVSANPTGPLHVGHGRGAAYGACVTNLLRAIGYDVHAEYYVNDAGRQMRILGVSTWLRYLELCGEKINLPDNAYVGDYIIDIAQSLLEQHSKAFSAPFATVLEKIPAEYKDNPEQAEKFIDSLVEAAKETIGAENFEKIRQASLNAILEDIKQDLEEFGVVYDEWFRESNLFDQGLLEEGVGLLKEHGYTYEKEGALWFKATELGDEKDRVLIRANGNPTYFASDVAYHLYKYNQGYDRIIDVFGADHHGYISRIKSFLKGLGKDPEQLKILLVQFAILYRGKEKVSMSTRKGQFVTLRELRQEVGNDAARFFYIMRKPEQHLDFDLELAKSQSNENPVYYIQYAHARICSVWRQLESDSLSYHPEQGLSALDKLNSEHEANLMKHLGKYPDVLQTAAINHQPHAITHYLYECANFFHSYYNSVRFLVDDDAERNARLCLLQATQQTITNGLTLLGVSSPDKM